MFYPHFLTFSLFAMLYPHSGAERRGMKSAKAGSGLVITNDDDIFFYKSTITVETHPQSQACKQDGLVGRGDGGEVDFSGALSWFLSRYINYDDGDD